MYTHTRIKYHLQTETTLLLSFQFGRLLFFRLLNCSGKSLVVCWIAVESVPPDPVPDCQRANFQSYDIECLLWIFNIYPLLCWYTFFLCPICLVFLSWKYVEILSNVLTVFVDMIIWYLSFILLWGILHLIICICWTLTSQWKKKSPWLCPTVLLMYCRIPVASILLSFLIYFTRRNIGL